MTRTLFLMLLLCAVSTAFGCRAAQQPVGGYAPVAVTGNEVVAATVFAVEAQRRAVKMGEPPASLELVEIAAAEQQVVSGINYRLELKVNVDGVDKDVEAVVWWQAWRKPEVYQLISWKWK